MSLPALAPRPNRPQTSAATRLQSVLTHSDSEWASFYPRLRQLYVDERRKLRHVMQQMENDYSFKATEQMYKKRFAKWGFQKNSKRTGAGFKSSSLKTQAKGGTSIQKTTPRLPASPCLSHGDGLMLMFFNSVHIWSTSFFESAESAKTQSVKLSLALSSPDINVKEANFAFKLVISLLDQGHGDLAGRMTRKAFLLVERMLTLEGPALLWNLLEMMYHMVTMRHTRLFQLMLAHLIGLIETQAPTAHPLPTILRGLRGVVGDLTSTPQGISPERSKKASTILDATEPLTSLLQRAWTLNAESILRQFDPHLFPLYFRIIWDSCSVNPPATIVRTLGKWINQIDSHQITSDVIDSHCFEKPRGSHGDGEDVLLKHLLAPRMDASPPRNYAMLHRNSLAALRQHGDSILESGNSSGGNTKMLLSVLAGIATAKVLDSSYEFDGTSSALYDEPKRVSRLHAGNLACIIGTLVDLDDTDHLPGSCLDTVERMRAIVALREYSEGETDPQTVLEIWLLQQALDSAGRQEEALEVKREAYRRMESYVQDIPVHSA